jgi:putative DNA primase/helicase
MSTPNLVSTPIADRLASLFGKREVPDPPASTPQPSTPAPKPAAVESTPASDPAREGDPTPPGKGDPRRWTDFDRDEADADRMFWPGPEPRRVVIDVSRPLSEQVSRTLLELNRRGILHSVDHKLVAASTDGSRIVQLSRPVTKAVVEDAIVCVAFVEKKTKRDGTVVPEGVSIVPTPRPLIDAIFERGDYPELRPLVGIRRDAFVGRHGNVVSQPGYDEASSLIFAPRPDYRPLPEVVTKDNAIAALRELEEVLVDFPLTPAGRSVAIAGMISCAARPCLGPTPMIIADAPVAGSGKTLLVEECAAIGLGEPVKSDLFRAEPAEFSKTLISSAMDGKGAIAIDNVAAGVPFGSAELDGMITARTGRMGVRLLGQSKKIEISTESVIFATGNGITLAGDGARRALWIRLDAGVEDPEKRTGFKQEFLYDWTLENLSRLHRAVLIIWEGFRQAGRPRSGKPPLGSFEKWSIHVRDLLIWLGQTDPLESRALIKERDPNREFLAAILPAMEKLDPSGKGLYVAQLVDAGSALTVGHQPKHPDLAAALQPLATTSGAIKPNLLGMRLKMFEGRIVNGRRLTSKMTRTATRLWFVEVVDAAAAAMSTDEAKVVMEDAASAGEVSP